MQPYHAAKRLLTSAVYANSQHEMDVPAFPDHDTVTSHDPNIAACPELSEFTGLIHLLYFCFTFQSPHAFCTSHPFLVFAATLPNA